MRRRNSFVTVLVGKNSLRREGLTRILRAENFRILASVSSADDLLSCKVQRCHLLFLIVHTSDDFDDAIEQIELFRDRHPTGRIAVVADHYRLSELVSAFRAGATGYFVDVMSCDAFIKSIELVMMGETVFPPAFLSFALDAEGAHLDKAEPRDDNAVTIDAPDDGIAKQLSPREITILRCLIEGDSNKCIARKIDIAEATVKVHIKAILRKIRVHNRTQAAIWGMNNRSLARSPADRDCHLNSDTNNRFPNGVPQVSEIKRIDDNVPLGVINHTSNSFEVSRVDEHIRKANGTIRLRK
jgi:DNA-binding NarL/FixJ family response regulator